MKTYMVIVNKNNSEDCTLIEMSVKKCNILFMKYILRNDAY